MTNKEKAIVKQHAAREWESYTLAKRLYGNDAPETTARMATWTIVWAIARDLGCSVNELLADMK